MFNIHQWRLISTTHCRIIRHDNLKEKYINRRTDDPRGTGGTPYMQWLKQLIDETRSHML